MSFAGFINRVRRKVFPPRSHIRLADRNASLTQEIAFWREWFEGKGLEWPDDYRRRFNPDLELQPELAALLPQLRRTDVDILDVGAGPITRLGKKSPGRKIRLVATDLLAAPYDRMLSELNVTPLLRTVYADAEKLVEQFGTASFDIVHAQNTVDHMEHPVVAIEQMIAVTRPGGFVYLRHEENEGSRTGFYTLHQWDLFLDDATGNFMLRHAHGKRYNLTREFASSGTCRCYREDKRVVFLLHKT